MKNVRIFRNSKSSSNVSKTRKNVTLFTLVLTPILARFIRNSLKFGTLFTLILALILACVAPVTEVTARTTSVNRNVRYCKERNMYDGGSVRHLNLNKKVAEERAVIYLYNMYYDPLQSAIARGFIPYGEKAITDNNYYNSDVGYYGKSPVYDMQGTPYYWDKSRGRYVDNNGNYYPDGYTNSSYYDNYTNYRSHNTAWRWAVDIGIISTSDRPNKTATHRWYYRLLRNFAFYVDGKTSRIYDSHNGTVRKKDAARIMRAFCEGRLDVDDLEDYGRVYNGYPYYNSYDYNFHF